MQTIDIRTAQHVAIRYELASLRERILAFFIDLTLVLVGYLLLYMLLAGAFRALFSSTMFWSVVVGLGPLASFILYSLIFEIANNGQTLGKQVLQIKVVRVDGQEASLSDYLLRAVFHLIDTFFSLGAIASILITSAAKNQRLGDLSANTTVIRTRSNMQLSLQHILSIDSIEAYTPVYPQVRQLKEADMLFIKEAIGRMRKHPNTAHQIAIQELGTRLCEVLEIEDRPKNTTDFLKTLIKDYIVLTR